MDQEKWFYQLNEQETGPVTKEELTNLLIQKILTKDTYVWTEGIENWQPVHTISDFAFVTPATRAPLRPTSVTVLGILNIVFGSLNLLCTPLAVVGLMVPQPENPFQMGLGMRIYTGIGLVVALICAIILLASGIGLLNLKRWARQTAYVYGWFAIAWGIIGIIVNILWIARSVAGSSEIHYPIFTSMCGGIIGFIYPVVLIIFLKKPNIVEACNR